MRNLSRRSFTVEAKSGGRRGSTIIPTRVAPPPVPQHASLFRSDPASTEPAAEKRRVLPNLIVPETPEPVQDPEPALEERPVRRPRGRPPKPRPLPVEPVAAPAKAAAPVPPPLAPVAVTVAGPAEPAQTPRRRKADPIPDLLPRGERWKTRRLGRWSR